MSPDFRFPWQSQRTAFSVQRTESIADLKIDCFAALAMTGSRRCWILDSRKERLPRPEPGTVQGSQWQSQRSAFSGPSTRPSKLGLAPPIKTFEDRQDDAKRQLRIWKRKRELGQSAQTASKIPVANLLYCPSLYIAEIPALLCSI